MKTAAALIGAAAFLCPAMMFAGGLLTVVAGKREFQTFDILKLTIQDKILVK
ncbi:MAG: hypothetical protein HKN28_04795 [Alphaproteobacteria bacterium]|nr:hypothetical protein [Alphaproteobacteria bacterium]